MNSLDKKQINQEFNDKFQKMLDLVARGRGVEILLRIAYQTAEGIEAVDESYESMMKSELKMKNPHPKQAAPVLFNDPIELQRVELARDIADKLAHGLYRLARLLIEKYKSEFLLKTALNSHTLDGWKMQADGHLFEDDGKSVSADEDARENEAHR